MRVFIAGIDGYLGWPLAQYLAARGMDVGGADLFLRRRWVEEMHSHSAIPIAPMAQRLEAFARVYGSTPLFREGDLRDYAFVERCLTDFRPDAIVHLGECPSAPYSQIDVHHAVDVQTNNVVSTLNILHAMRDHCPDAHLVKLGTMGEYGTPPVDIPEGFFEIEYRGRTATLPFPRQAGSWYHWSKVHDSNNVMFACRLWGLRSTDIMQGVVYGTRTPEMNDEPVLATRFDFDQSFGTAINRFCAQAVIGHPLTLYGKGHQKRGFLPLRDAMQCLHIALTRPPDGGEYRVFNQFEDVYDLTELATRVQAAARQLGLQATIEHLDNPRVELEDHYYHPDRRNLIDRGYKPSHDLDAELRVMLADLRPHADRILARQAVLLPDIRWRGAHRRVGVVT